MNIKSAQAQLRELVELVDRRIPAALQRIYDGHGLMRVPAEDTDPDLVLADCKKYIESLLSETAQRENNWMETAAQNQRNANFYRGIVVQIGELFGREAYISDDGSVQQDVLALKVLKLVEAKLSAVPIEELERIMHDKVESCDCFGKPQWVLREKYLTAIIGHYRSKP